MERALLEHIDQRIKLATREAVREPLTASMVDLYCYIKNDYNVFMSHFSVPRVECVILVGSEFSIQNDIFICFFFSSWEFALMPLLDSGFGLQWLMLRVSCLGLG